MPEQRPASAPFISWFPTWVHDELLVPLHAGAARGEATSAWRCMRPRSECWDTVVQGLIRAGDVLRSMPVADIVAAIDRAAERWCDRGWPARIAARDHAVMATGFSPEAVDRSFDVELRNYRAESLWRALRRELGNPAVLDGPCADRELAGATMAIGPRVTLEIFTGNVPGLPALSIVRALMTKSAVIAKVASGEPTFAAQFVRSLADIDARLGDAIAITYWDRDDRVTLDAVLAHVDAVVVYGSDAACAAIRSAVRPDQRLLEHSHKLSVGLLSRAYLLQEGAASVAAAVARDVSMFDQHACIASQAYLVEGEMDEVHALSIEVAHAMEAYARECPPGRLSRDDAAALQMQRAAADWCAAAGGTARDAWHGENLDWTVILDDDLHTGASSGHRVLRLVPVARMDVAIELLRPYGRYLQNVAVGALDREMPSIVRHLALLGASRICQPGRMADPSMAWRHDGRMCIADLLRWCDIEMHPWTESTEVDGFRDR